MMRRGGWGNTAFMKGGMVEFVTKETPKNYLY